jgi:hypothetical protein
VNQGHAQYPLTLNVVQLLEPGQKVEAPGNIVYSTSPKTAVGLDGHDYILKGPEIEIIVAEAAAYLLARIVRLPVPEFGIASIGDQPYFASRKAHIRNVEAYIRRGALTNTDVLLETIVFDVWIANVDRNMGNFVGDVADMEARRVRLLVIDFEKAACLRERTPLVIVPTINPRKLWPKDALGQILTGRPCPREFCDRIASVSEGEISHSLDMVARHVPGIPWMDSCIQVLRRRAEEIHHISREVWR